MTATFMNSLNILVDNTKDIYFIKVKVRRSTDIDF